MELNQDQLDALADLKTAAQNMQRLLRYAELRIQPDPKHLQNANQKMDRALAKVEPILANAHTNVATPGFSAPH